MLRADYVFIERDRGNTNYEKSKIQFLKFDKDEAKNYLSYRCCITQNEHRMILYKMISEHRKLWVAVQPSHRTHGKFKHVRMPLRML